MKNRRCIESSVAMIFLDIVSSYKSEVIPIAEKSRADYFKGRRKATKAFYVEIEKETLDCFEALLKTRKQTKKSWLTEKIDEELKK